MGEVLKLEIVFTEYKERTLRVIPNKKHGGEIELEMHEDFGSLDINKKPAQTSQKVESTKKLAHPVTFYAEDTIVDLKNKIYLSSGIPPVRQHLFYKLNNQNFAIGYRIITNVYVSVNIEDAAPDYVDNIPINNVIYNERDILYVEAFENFRILGDLPCRRVYVVDANDFFGDKLAVSKLIENESIADLIYWGFVVLFFPQMTPTVFQEYIKNEEALKTHYPLLYPNYDNIKKQYTAEKKIMDAVSNRTKLNISIEEAHLQIESNSVINLRNLFDYMSCQEPITYIKLQLVHNFNKIMLLKRRYGATVRRETLGDNSLLVNLHFTEADNIEFTLIVRQAGGYKVRTTWREDQRLTFAEVVKITAKHINPYIAYINSLPNVASHKLSSISERTAHFSCLNIGIYWEKILNKEKFDKLVHTFNQFIEAKFAVPKETKGNILTYIWKKGIYRFDHTLIDKITTLSNQYQYLSDSAVRMKWEGLYAKNRPFEIHHRFVDVKFLINNIKEEEFRYLYAYLNTFISMLPAMSTTQELRKTENNLKKLKEQDPILYDWKTKNNTVYSRICQKSHQPISYNEEEFKLRVKSMSAEERENMVKYWNITTQKPAWYECPNKKYKYLGFMTDTHPQGYCVPCCKKLPTAHRSVFKSCIEHHKLVEEVEQTSSRYVMTYGTRSIDVGRISRLPENTLEPLFHDTYSTHFVVDEECKKQLDYYIYGVPQHAASVSNVGLLFCIMDALGLEFNKLVETAIHVLKDNENMFFRLLSGEVLQYYASTRLLVDDMLRVFVGGGASEFSRWNELFHDIFLMYGLRIIHFIDTGNEAVDLLTPPLLDSSSEYINAQNLMVIERQSEFYPIYYIDKVDYYREKLIEKKIFDPQDKAMLAVAQLVEHSDAELSVFRHYDIDIIRDFCANSSYSIVRKYLNIRDICYGLLIQKVDTANRRLPAVYIPIQEIYQKIDKICICYEPFKRNKWNLPAGALLAFVAEINQFAEKKRNKIYSVRPEQWNVYRNKIIGFMSNNKLYRINDIPANTHIPGEDSTPRHSIFFDPDEINEIIFHHQHSELEVPNLARALYNHYVYDLILLELMSLIRDDRNTRVRKLLGKQLQNINTSNYDARLQNIRAMPEVSQTDYSRLMLIITESIQQKSKITLAERLENTSFEFDQCIINNILKHRPNVSKMRAMIQQLLRRVVVVVARLPNIQFRNLLAPCSDTNSEFAGELTSICKGKKLIITNKKFQECTDLLLNDLSIDTRRNYLFTNIYIRSHINYYRFINRPGEEIYSVIL